MPAKKIITAKLYGFYVSQVRPALADVPKHCKISTTQQHASFINWMKLENERPLPGFSNCCQKLSYESPRESNELSGLLKPDILVKLFGMRNQTTPSRKQFCIARCSFTSSIRFVHSENKHIEARINVSTLDMEYLQIVWTAQGE